MNVDKSFRCSAIFATIAFTSLSCANGSIVKDEHAGPVELRVDEYYESGRKYNRKKITVAGYLISQGEVLHLDKSARGPQSANDPTMLIWDSTPSTESGFDVIYQSHQCTDQYVKITGLIGEIPDLNMYGMTEIFEIRVFEDGSFRGQGELCYTKS